jgi:predicted aspartyl protease
MSRTIRAILLSSGLALAAVGLRAGAAEAPATPEAPAAKADQLPVVVIEAPEPQFVVPTRRDRIGRIWAPVTINGKGPFRLVFDTGASRSGVTAAVAAALGIAPDESRRLRLRGVTGTATVPTIRADSFQLGDLLLQPLTLPVLADAFGGAEGILGTEGLDDKRVRIEFRKDRIVITRSHSERAGPGFLTIPLERSRGKLLVVDARMGNVPIKAVIGTGGQATIGNLALRDALRKRRQNEEATVDTIIGATLDVQEGEGRSAPSIHLGSIQIRSAHVTFGDMRIFEHWNLTGKPAVLIGMDALGLLDTLIIDYRLRELQVKLADGS